MEVYLKHKQEIDYSDANTPIVYVLYAYYEWEGHYYGVGLGTDYVYDRRDCVAQTEMLVENAEWFRELLIERVQWGIHHGLTVNYIPFLKAKYFYKYILE